MSDFSIQFRWEDPLDARGRELRATWSTLRILVHGRPVTRVFDERSLTVRDIVRVPLYPLAERLASQWWALWNEPSPSGPLDRPGYEARHCLAGAREGYAFPPLRIDPLGAVVRLSWAPERLPAHGIEFIGSGACRTETQPVKREISSFIDTVVNRLHEMGIADSPLQQDWQAIGSADPEEIEFCECAGALGLDPYSLDESARRQIVEAARRLSEPITGEFFRAARSADLLSDSERISAALSRARSDTTDLERLRNLRGVTQGWLHSSGAMPWEEGYAFAGKLRAYLALDGHRLKSFANVASALGVTEDDLSGAFTEFPGQDTPFVGLMGLNERMSPTFAFRKARPQSALFHFSRALFEYLCSQEDRSALITEANTERQKRNRAFAAEWLAPAPALKALVKDAIVTWEQTEELAEEFGVSSYVVRHQLQNHDIALVQDVHDT